MPIRKQRRKPPRSQKSLIQRALESRVRELENSIAYCSHDNDSARQGWQRVYEALYPEAIDGPQIGGHIGGTIHTILDGIAVLRVKAGIAEGRNAY